MSRKISDRHKARLDKISRDPGTFVYNGSGVAVEHSPTPAKFGKKEPKLDSDGMPVIDSNGKQVFEKPGRTKTDSEGKPILGGAPKENRVPLASMKILGVEFPKGKPIYVKDCDLAVKLRCLPQIFDEVETKAEKLDKPDKK